MKNVRGFLVTSLLLVLCLSFTVHAQVVTVDFLNFSSSGENEVHLKKMHEIFEAQNPNIKVNIQTVGYDEYFVRLMTSVVAGTAPDAFELNFENFAAYAMKGTIQPLEELIERSGFDTSVSDASALAAFTSGGTQYGLPFSFSNVIVLYNKDLFDRANVAYPTSEWTWDDQLAAAKKIRALDDDIFGIFQPIQFHEFYKIVGQNGGSLFNDDRTKFTVNTPENVATLQYMVDRVQKYNVMPTEEQLSGMGDWDLFAAGRLGMLVTGSWAFPYMAENCDFEWDIAVEPGNIAKATHFFANGLVINKNTKKADAAFEWIKFLSASKEAAEIRVQAGWELPAVTYQEILDMYAATTPPESKAVIFESLQYLVTPPVIEQFEELSDILGRHLSDARDGFVTPEEALEAGQEELEARITL
ncbi:MAG: sugar ABC transporter substrate-binding protein [Limnochordia bacterium]|nr:sugar ABC transporter substrate-binding protein [Limnochordia bacterium]